MTIEKKHYYLRYANQLVIYIASLLGLFFDVNAACFLALTLWLWLPQCLFFELKLLNRLSR